MSESSESSYSYSTPSRKSYSQPYDDNNYSSHLNSSSVPDNKPNVVSISKTQDKFDYQPEKSSLPTKDLSPEEKKKARTEITKIKKKLKSIEDSVVENFSLEETQAFTKIFREIIMNNEQQVMSFPTASFFITKFEQSDSSLLNEHFKQKILNKLNEIHDLDKQKNSKLKYW